MSDKQAREGKNVTDAAEKLTVNRRLFLKGTAATALCVW
jgi:hypothetical protein